MHPMADLSPLHPERVRPLRRAEYERLVELGVFEDERLELLRGALVTMSPQGGLHADTVARIGEALTLALAGRARVRQHSPIAVADDSEPEPDVAVVPLGGSRLEVPGTAFLVVEVADSSLSKDRNVKAALYAAAGIPEYWLVDLNGHAVEVHRAPGSAGCGDVTRLAASGATLRLAAFADVALSLDEMFG